MVGFALLRTIYQFSGLLRRTRTGDGGMILSYGSVPLPCLTVTFPILHIPFSGMVMMIIVCVHNPHCLQRSRTRRNE